MEWRRQKRARRQDTRESALEFRAAVVLNVLDQAGGARRFAVPHGAQLEHVQRRSLPSHATVRDQRRTARKQAECERANGEERQRQQEQNDGCRALADGYGLPVPIGIGRRLAKYRKRSQGSTYIPILASGRGAILLAM